MSRPTEKKIYIENLGCSKNQVDAETMIRYLEDGGWTVTGDPEDSECVIVNSCGFIRPAKEESIDTALAFRKEYPDKTIILSGCLAQRYGEELSGLYGTVDGIFGNRALSEIPAFLERIETGKTQVYRGEKVEALPFRHRFLSLPGSVYVKISEGCNNRCSFCAIPIIRGQLVSRSRGEVLDEIRGLLDMGMFELNLVGQDLGSYGSDTGGGGITELLSDIADLDGDFWVRLLYIHPDHFPPGLLDICRQDRRILPYFDIPFQHASSGILSRMGRRGTADTYLDLAASIRENLPDAVLRTTFLVGFPGETRKDFAELAAFREALNPDWLGVFTYSREEGTAAAGMGRLFSPASKTAEKRRDRLMKDQEASTARNLERFKGRELPVFMEERVEGEDLSLGRIYAQAPEVDGLTVVNTAKVEPGTVIRCRIIGVHGYDLEAVPTE